jgi:prephenate dehydratase
MHWKKVTDFVIRLPHRPGALASLASRLREADIEMIGMWGPVQGRHTMGFHCIPERAEQFRNFTRDSELDAFEQTAFLVDVPAKAGGLVMVLDAIAQAGINIETIQSITDDRSLAAILWVDEADEPHLQQVLSRE